MITRESDERLLRRLFEDALRLPVEERGAFVASWCEGDRGSRFALEALLEAAER